jgi:superfamily II DNA or RNA helicase
MGGRKMAVSTDSLAVTRTSLRFDWSEVDERLLRWLLVAAYEAEGRSKDVLLLRGQSGGSLVKKAQGSLGRPPNVRYMDSMVDVLRDHWLPTLNRDQLDRIIWDVQLALTGPDRKAEPRNKADKVDFLTRRNRTDTFKCNLRAAFIREHKTEAVAVGSVPGLQRRQSGVVELIGLGESDRRSPFPHQLAAWQSLDAMASSRPSNRRSGLVELPTGSGKTYTLVVWLLKRMQEEVKTRVLWIADQQELVDQAARSFEEQAAYLPPDFVSRLRIVHGTANPATTLADGDLDVACVTRQSLLGKQLDAAARARLQAFLTRPTVVVVDEAHHAVSKTCRQLLELIRSIAPTTIFVGMTATPWPSGYGMTQRLNELFPVNLARVQVRDLVKSGVLARPVFHTAQTGETVRLDPAELKQMVGRDVPPSVLRGLDRPGRNATIVNTWNNRREEWGKTLVFACDIEHADHLGELFAAEGAEVTVVHSRAEIERSGALHRFRIRPGPSVLVSVGMLLEGVDVPDARTAFLTRPTTSRILMRQMVGRVLRGEAGGGEATAHVVDLRDRWEADVDVLAPVEIPGLGCPVIETNEDQAHVLPAVLDEKTGDPLGEDVLRSIARAYGELRSRTPMRTLRHSPARRLSASTSWVTSTSRSSTTRRRPGPSSSLATYAGAPGAYAVRSSCLETCRSRGR